MAKKTFQEIRVGIFIFIGIVLAFVMIFSIGGQEQLFQSQYDLYANFTDVAGLREGAPVRLSGVDVGTVSRIWFLSDIDAKMLGVELRLDSRVQERIRKDSVASIKTMGVLGDKYISITMGSSHESVLGDGDYIESTDPIEMYAFLDRGDKIVKNIESITESLDSLLVFMKEEESGENVASILTNIDEIVSEVREGEGTLHALIYGGKSTTEESLSSLDSSLSRLDSILTKIDEGEGTLGALVNDPSAYEDLKIILGGAKRSKALKAVVNITTKKGEEALEETEIEENEE
ncbi:MAG: MCE family protein [Deltaproteobacteria bacterium]|nr:MCE family protein [Candidatus Zymogenaceae bacterium]